MLRQCRGVRPCAAIALAALKAEQWSECRGRCQSKQFICPVLSTLRNLNSLCYVSVTLNDQNDIPYFQTYTLRTERLTCRAQLIQYGSEVNSTNPASILTR